MEPRHTHWVTSADELAELYELPSERAIAKQISYLDQHCRTFIAASPFAVLATCGDAGVNCSPRGDAPGFAHVLDEQTLLIPDRRGNNRLDSIRNILDAPEVGVLFLVPGVEETLRVNGRARVSRDPLIRLRFSVRGSEPATVLVIHVREAFIQCSRALVRSRLWDPERHVPRATLPSLGTVLAAHTSGRVDADEYDRGAAARVNETRY